MKLIWRTLFDFFNFICRSDRSKFISFLPDSQVRCVDVVVVEGIVLSLLRFRCFSLLLSLLFLIGILNRFDRLLPKLSSPVPTGISVTPFVRIRILLSADVVSNGIDSFICPVRIFLVIWILSVLLFLNKPRGRIVNIPSTTSLWLFHWMLLVLGLRLIVIRLFLRLLIPAAIIWSGLIISIFLRFV